MGKHYVYVLKRPNGEIFYVGKGSGDRMHRHVLEATRPNPRIYNPYKTNVILKILNSGEQVGEEKVFETDNEHDAYIYEWFMYWMYKDQLTNLKEGGLGGIQGRKATEEERKAIGDRSRGRKWPEHRYEIARKEGKGKVWPGFISPDGTVYRNIPNLNEFCKEHGLSTAPMFQVDRGKQESHKGWKSISPYITRPRKKPGRPRIHPLPNPNAPKKPMGRPRKFPPKAG